MGDPQDTSSERTFIARLLARDESAFRTLIERYHGALVRFVRNFVSSQASAEEIAQETWLAVLEGLARFEVRSTLKTWIFHIAANRAKTRGVREGRSVSLSVLAEDTAPVVAPDRFSEKGAWTIPLSPWTGETPERDLDRKELRAELERALFALPERQRIVVTLRDIEGLDSEEVCQVLEISEANQRVLLHRGRSLLRTELEGRFSGKHASC